MSSSTSPIGSLASYSGNYFSGMSNYSQDLNNAISREVQIAQLPITLLQDNVTTLTSQSSELQTLSGLFSSVQSAVANIDSAAGSAMSATVSQPSVATATLGSFATAGTYSLQVTNLGSYSDALSTSGLTTVTDPTSQNLSSSNSYKLTVNNVTTSISVPNGNLNALAQAIDSANAGVQATVISVGTATAPDYRLSLQSDQYGSVSMQLNDGTTDLLAPSGATGQAVQYTINGQAVSSGSRTVTVAQGLTLNLTGTNPDTAATITVAPDATNVGNALSNFVSSYNQAITELGKNRGQGTGALVGQSIVYELTDALQGIPNYSTGAGSMASLAAVGLSFNDDTGQLSFDQSAFDTATSGSTDPLTQFLGSATGGGFLEMATNTLNGLLDPTSGVLTEDINTVQSSITSINSQITTEQDQVTQLQTNLTQQMSAADAMIYELQQQSTEMQDMFTAMQDSEIGSANGA
jgi:flagellar hook-associated protein 2